MSGDHAHSGRVVLETARLTLREFTPDDAPLLFDLNQDPQVMVFVRTAHTPSLEEIQRELLPGMLQMYREHPGLGVFPAFEQRTGEYIGWFHFRPARDAPADIDLGYRLYRRYWGRGYATEASRALVRYGFEQLGVARVIAHALLANRASIRVMEKAGLRFEKHFDEPRALFADQRAVKYALDRETYFAEVR